MAASRKLVLIVAASENDVIGNEGGLPWRLSADLRRFKRLTMGHSIIMGRRTYESIGRLLPGRKTIIVSRQSDYRVPGAVIVDSVAATFQNTQDDECPYVIGGAAIYGLFLPFATELQLTRVHGKISGDTHLPPIQWDQWNLEETTLYRSDANNSFDYSFEVYRRITDN